MNATEYTLVLAKIDLKELNKLDAALIRRLKKHNGLARSDCAIWIMRQVKNMGSGCRSFVDTYLRALIRDMEEVLHNAALQGVIARSSLKLCRQVGNDGGNYRRAFVHNNITLARYGIYLRDRLDLDISIFMELLLKTAQIFPRIISRNPWNP